jgi:hypothetical protein
LTATENQTLLRGWDTGLLLDLLLDTCDLKGTESLSVILTAIWTRSAHLVVDIDIELDLDAESTD